MTTDWSALEEELDAWAAQALTLPLWWRDDDAISATPKLERLTGLSEETGLPVHLAIIPAGADATLARHISVHPQMIPVVHGWAHENHSPAGEKKAEFGSHRETETVRADMSRGLARLKDMLGPSLRPMFVPPWNRIAPDIVRELPTLGYRAVSTYTPRKQRFAADGLEQINTHLDPINWRGDRSLVPPPKLLEQVVRQLQDRRAGRADNTEPYGILTHHLVHDEAIWSFTHKLISTLMAGPATVWTLPEKQEDLET